MATETTTPRASSGQEKSDRYIEGIGMRKTAVARVRITPSSKNTYVVNEKTLQEYFPTTELQKIIEDVLLPENIPTFSVSIRVNGGGVHSQAESVQLGIARALLKDDEGRRKDLKKAGYLKRDPRAKERKKPGLKKARKAAQWSKR